MCADQINSLRNLSIKSRLIADGLKYAQIEIWAECHLRFPATPRSFAASCVATPMLADIFGGKFEESVTTCFTLGRGGHWKTQRRS